MTRPEHIRWLKAQKHNLGALTGTDAAALAVIAPAWLLYASTGSEAVLRAIALAAGEMQPSTRYLARELIPYALDWGDRDRLWPRVLAFLGGSAS